jgi:hypothetical protein
LLPLRKRFLYPNNLSLSNLLKNTM